MPVMCWTVGCDSIYPLSKIQLWNYSNYPRDTPCTMQLQSTNSYMLCGLIPTAITVQWQNLSYMSGHVVCFSH